MSQKKNPRLRARTSGTVGLEDGSGGFEGSAATRGLGGGAAAQPAAVTTGAQALEVAVEGAVGSADEFAHDMSSFQRCNFRWRETFWQGIFAALLRCREDTESFGISGLETVMDL